MFNRFTKWLTKKYKEECRSLNKCYICSLVDKDNYNEQLAVCGFHAQEIQDIVDDHD